MVPVGNRHEGTAWGVCLQATDLLEKRVDLVVAARFRNRVSLALYLV